MPRYRNGKISAGVLNNSDSNTNEMSYVDMHDLHPENVQAATVSGATHGAITGGMFGAMLGAIPTLLLAESKEEKFHFTGKSLGIGAAVVALCAIVMGSVQAYTAKKDAETHNKWSDRVLSRMEAREAEEASKHADAVVTGREQNQQAAAQVGG